MKKTLTAALAAMMALSMTACSSANSNTSTQGSSSASTEESSVITGGWENAATAVDADIKAMCEKAVDSAYTPVAVLSTQVVAGTNYKILFTHEEDGKQTWAVGTIYEDLQGNVSLSEMEESGLETNLSTDALGAWQLPESPEVSAEVQEVFDKAMEGLVGVNYTPLAVAAEQVVNGTNYLILCEAETVTPDAEPYYATVQVCKDSSGNVTLGEIVAFGESAQ